MVYFLKIILLSLAISPSVFASEYFSKEELSNAKSISIFAENRMIDTNSRLNEVSKLNDKFTQVIMINKLFNEVSYVSDLLLYGIKDKWATPYEFMLNDSGDCEDFVISKYKALHLLGFKHLFIAHTYVKDVAHLVLMVGVDDKVYILDNNTSKIKTLRSTKDYIIFDAHEIISDKLS